MLQSINTKAVAGIVRGWFLFHFGVMGVGLIVGFAVTTIRLTSEPGTPLGVSRSAFVGLAAFTFGYSLAHLVAFAGILRRTSWSWVVAVALTVSNLLLRGATMALPIRTDPTAYIVMGLLVLELFVFFLPGIRASFGPRPVAT